MFIFCAETRSAWRKSIDRALEMVTADKMTEAFFLANAPASPDSRDPNPQDMLTSRLRRAAEAEVLQAAATERKQREAEAREQFIREHRDLPVWHLAGFYVDDLSRETYTLAQIEQWCDWARGYLGSEQPDLSAVAIVGESTVTVPLDMVYSGRRVTPFHRACCDLAQFSTERAANA